MVGDDRVSVSDVLDVDPRNPRATIVADLSRAEAIASDTYDCFILTQTLGVIFDTASVLAHIYRILKPGGVLLCTAPAIGRLSYEEGSTATTGASPEASAATTVCRSVSSHRIRDHGVRQRAGLCCVPVRAGPRRARQAELDKVDPYFPVVYGVRALKPEDGRSTLPLGAVRAANAS